MRGFILRLGCAAAAFVGLSGFDNQPKLPPDYSPNYSYVDVVGPNGKMRRVLVPDSCLAEEPEPPLGHMGGPALPLGCANAFNLQHMVERKNDLVIGRHLGHAPATTAARAAVKYLSGPENAHPQAATGNAPPPLAAPTPKD